MPRSLAADAGLYWPVCLSWPLVGWTMAIRQSAPCQAGHVPDEGRGRVRLPHHWKL